MSLFDTKSISTLGYLLQYIIIFSDCLSLVHTCHTILLRITYINILRDSNIVNISLFLDFHIYTFGGNGPTSFCPEYTWSNWTIIDSYIFEEFSENVFNLIFISVISIFPFWFLCWIIINNWECISTLAYLSYWVGNWFSNTFTILTLNLEFVRITINWIL